MDLKLFTSWDFLPLFPELGPSIPSYSHALDIAHPGLTPFSLRTSNLRQLAHASDPAATPTCGCRSMVSSRKFIQAPAKRFGHKEPTLLIRCVWYSTAELRHDFFKIAARKRSSFVGTFGCGHIQAPTSQHHEGSIGVERTSAFIIAANISSLKATRVLACSTINIPQSSELSSALPSSTAVQVVRCT